MPIIQRFDEQKKIVFVIWDGGVTAEEWLRTAPQLVTHPAWHTVPRLLADLRSVVETSTIHTKQIDEAIEIFVADPTALTGKKFAVIASDAFGKARYFGNSLSHFGVSTVVFNNMDTACLFLGIDVTYAYQAIEQMRAQLEHE